MVSGTGTINGTEGTAHDVLPGKACFEDCLYNKDFSVMCLKVALSVKHWVWGLLIPKFLNQNIINLLNAFFSRLRKALKIVQGDRKRFVKKEITTEILENAAKSNPAAIAEAKHLQVNPKL